MTLHRMLAWAALLAGIAFVLGCGGEVAEPSGESSVDVDVDAPPEAPAVNVTTTKLAPESLEDELRLTGRLEPWVEVQISTELGGTVQEIGFEKGRQVTNGQVLARIGTDLLEASLAEAEAELAGAEATYDKAKELFDRQAVPRQELIDATAMFQRAEARVQHARLRVERSVIRSPTTGMAVTREIELGEVVPPGALVTTVHQISRLKANVGIPEDDIAFFAVGGSAAIEVDAFPGKEFSGRIHFVAPAATGQNRTFPAEIAIVDAAGLKPGMIARVFLVRRVYEEAVIVPRDAVLERDTGNVAFVEENGRAVLRSVVTGPSQSGRIVVTEGLALGESLIVTGHRNLIDGQRVNVVSSSSASDRASTPAG